tara:strand:- start:1732 stop:2340 length:609 start_codon:yes stop_codon:yes gene_type:complete
MTKATNWPSKASPELQKKMSELQGLTFIRCNSTPHDKIGIRLRRTERIDWCDSRGTSKRERFDRSVAILGNWNNKDDYEKVYRILIQHILETRWEPCDIEKMRGLALSLERKYKYPASRTYTFVQQSNFSKSIKQIMTKQPRYSLELTHKQLSEIEEFYEKRINISLGEGINREDLADAYDVLAKINNIYSENAVEMWGHQV